MEKLEDMKSKLLEMQQKFRDEMEQTKNELQVTHSEQMDLILKKNESNLKELEDQLICQIELNQKWRLETKIIVAKLEGQIKRQREVIRRLHQVNWNLKKKLKGKSREKKNHQQDLTVLTNPSQIETKMKNSRKEHQLKLSLF
ncbi:hypothetical protein HHI36_011269 [Cryptolaemus montrouzieri]|uniref:Uncharacterized protein n=1 Tax=Cryptolaemus montrouzieri TaxID=559131 RepID=A0ABD2ML67_9CUCU